MWVLKHFTATDKTHYLPKSKSRYIVGRSQADILLGGDSSISREHAIIEIKESNGEIIAGLIDKGSKYGTYINNGITMKEKLPPNETYNLKSNDNIRFGMLQNLWTVTKVDLKVVTSTLPTELKQQLSNYINKLGGSMENAWSDNCTHLTMPVITMTMKVVQALCCAIPIVTMDFWKKYYESVMENNILPDPENFIPPLYESLLDSSVISFKVNINRKSVFNEKTFIFLSIRQHGQFSGIINTAGGRAVLLEKVKMSKSALCDPNNIVIHYVASAHSQSSQSIHMMEEIESFLRKKDRRVIPESDIGLAVLYCSVEKYCNPLYKYDEKLLRKSLSNPTQKLILAPDTDACGSRTQKDFKVTGDSGDKTQMIDSLHLHMLNIPESVESETSKGKSPSVRTRRAANQSQKGKLNFLRSSAKINVSSSATSTQKSEKNKEKSVTAKDNISRTTKTSLDIEEDLSDVATQKYVKGKDTLVARKDNKSRTTNSSPHIQEVLSDAATQRNQKSKDKFVSSKDNDYRTTKNSLDIEEVLSDAATRTVTKENKEKGVTAKNNSNQPPTPNDNPDLDISFAETQEFVNKPSPIKEIDDTKKRKRESPERKGNNVVISSFFQPLKKRNTIESNKVPISVPTTGYVVQITNKIRSPVIDSDDEGDISFRSTVASSTLKSDNPIFKPMSKNMPNKRKHDDDDDVFGFVSKEPTKTPQKKTNNVMNPFRPIVRQNVDLSGIDWSSKELSQVQADKADSNVTTETTDGLKRKGTFADEETNAKKKPNTLKSIFKFPVKSKKAITNIMNSTTKNPDLNISRETLNLSKITEFNKTININYSRNFEKNCIIDWLSCEFNKKLDIKREDVDIDDDTKEFIESVRNGINVYFKKIPIISKPPVNITDMDVTGVVNFKKFRKTQPLRTKTNPVALIRYVINPRERVQEVSLENESSDEETFGTSRKGSSTLKNTTKNPKTKRAII